jgi:glycosyltransferase involved in cell wall biosynthesis
MSIVWLTKRHYTHKDALSDRFGRVYELPYAWANAGERASLELVDYRGRDAAYVQDGPLEICSTPLRSPAALIALRRRVIRARPKVVVASGDCFMGLLAWRLSRSTGARFVFDVYDDYRSFGAYRLFAGFRAYEFLLARAALVLYASNALASRHQSPSSWMLVPNGVDPTLFRAGDRAEARARVGLADAGTRWIGYFGGMEPERGPDDLIDAVGRLHTRDPSIRLVLCGPPLPRATPAPWVVHRGAVPHEAIPDYINACDVVTLPYRRGPVIDMASSCKIAEYLYCRRPVVATRTPNLLENFSEQATQLGSAICAPGDPVDMARAISRQLHDPVIASLPEEHTWQRIASRTMDAIRPLVQE